MPTKAKPKPKPRRKPDRPRAPGAPFSVAQAAVELNESERSVRQYLETGRLKGYRAGLKGKLWRIPEAEVAEFQAARLGQGGAARHPDSAATAPIGRRPEIPRKNPGHPVDPYTLERIVRVWT